MFTKNVRLFGVLLCLCGLVVSSGCAGKGNKDEELDPELLGGGIPLDERFEDRERINDVSLAPVRFSYDSFQIIGSEIRKIEAAADYMKMNPGSLLITEGHCDERGSRDYNISLGEHRAHAVRAHLTKLGIKSKRIQTRSYGEEKPLDFGHNDGAWRLNRRVEFALYR